MDVMADRDGFPCCRDGVLVAGRLIRPRPSYRRKVKVVDALQVTLAILAALLQSHDFRSRQAIDLARAPHHVLLLLTHHSDPEVRWRAARELERHRVETIRQLVESNRPLPWIDALGPEVGDRSEIINDYLSVARERCTAEEYARLGAWPHWRIATELYLFTLSAADATRVLSAMPRNSYWNGKSWTTPPPENLP